MSNDQVFNYKHLTKILVFTATFFLSYSLIDLYKSSYILSVQLKTSQAHIKVEKLN